MIRPGWQIISAEKARSKRNVLVIGLYFSFIYFGYVCRLEPGWTYKTGTNKRLSRMNALPFSSFDIQSIPPHTI
jgi:hypothetical protein